MNMLGLGTVRTQPAAGGSHLQVRESRRFRNLLGGRTDRLRVLPLLAPSQPWVHYSIHDPPRRISGCLTKQANSFSDIVTHKRVRTHTYTYTYIFISILEMNLRISMA